MYMYKSKDSINLACVFTLFIDILSEKVSVLVTLMVRMKLCLSVGLSVYPVMSRITRHPPSGLCVLPGMTI